jgi:hypothetical protein
MSNFDKAIQKIKSTKYYLTGLNFDKEQSDELIKELDKIYKCNLLEIKTRTIQ